MPDELLERREEEQRRDGEEALRLLYVAATRARDLLVVPVVGDRSAAQEDQEQGWLRKLGPVIYPPPDAVRSPDSRNAPGCPAFWRRERRPASLQRAVGTPIGRAGTASSDGGCSSGSLVGSEQAAT